MEEREHVVIVDKNNNKIRKEDKMYAHERGLLHRAFSILLYRKKKGTIELLLQKRVKKKYHCGGLWSNTCCSHPRWEESILDAGKRRLKEEMGIGSVLKSIGSFQYKIKLSNNLIENEVDHVLTGYFDSDLIFFNRDEVEAIKWISHFKVMKEYEHNKKLFTPWFEPVFILFRQKMMNNDEV